MSDLYLSHYSVLKNECLDFATLSAEGFDSPLFADMTFGAGGHTLALSDLKVGARVFSTDQDPDAIANGRKIIKAAGKEESVTLLKMNYEEFPAWVKEQTPKLRFQFILMDLGVSSHHFDKFERGFSFREDATLDMRMDFESGNPTAADILNEYSEEEIANIIFKYGEERLSRRIAKGIIEFRSEKPISRTKELENICFHAYPARQRHGKTHPATRTFQALRIFVNRELEVLENSIAELYDILAPGGMLAIISFHSLEDRITKHKFKEMFQCDVNTGKILTKKPIYPSERELEENSRSRSAKLRVLQKL